MNTALQANIKKQLNEKNMSAAELERRTGIPHAVINILHGRSKNPSIRTAQAIAKELGCSLEDLLAEVSEQSSPSKVKTSASQTNSWHPELYKQAFNAVYDCIQLKNLQPEAKQIADCITEAYIYALGSPHQTVDLRFVQWVVDKNLQL